MNLAGGYPGPPEVTVLDAVPSVVYESTHGAVAIRLSGYLPSVLLGLGHGVPVWK